MERESESPRGALGVALHEGMVPAVTIVAGGTEQTLRRPKLDIEDLPTQIVNNRRNPIVVFIERYGGLTTILRLCARVGDVWSVSVPVRGGEEVFRWINGPRDEELRKQIEDLLHRDAEGNIIADGSVDALESFLESHEHTPKLQLVFPRIDALDPDTGRQLASLIRRAWENGNRIRPGRRRVAMIASAASTGALRDNLQADFSGLLNWSDGYRPVWFGRSHILALAGREDLSARMDEATVGRIMRFCGGQPYVVDHLLAELKARPGGTLEDAMGAVRDTVEPPAAQWRAQLSTLLRRARHVRQVLEEYIISHKRADRLSTIGEKELFLAGWLGCEEDEGWSIRSQLHEEWARQVLFDMRGAR